MRKLILMTAAAGAMLIAGTAFSARAQANSVMAAARAMIIRNHPVCVISYVLPRFSGTRYRVLLPRPVCLVLSMSILFCRDKACQSSAVSGKNLFVRLFFSPSPIVKYWQVKNRICFRKGNTIMGEIIRKDVNEEWAHSGIVKAGDYCFLSYCVGNIGGTVEEQVNGAFDDMEQKLALFGLTLENVVHMDCLFRDVWNIPVMEKVIKERFNGKYPARKSIQTEFAHVGGKDGLQFQADAVAYCG